MNGYTVRPKRRGLPVVPVLFVIITVLTLVEIALIFVLANLMGWLLTILLAVVTAIVGAVMIRLAGLAVLKRLQDELHAGRFPGQAIAEGALILVGGAFLMTPGLITDLAGISTLIPATRGIYARFLVRWAKQTFVTVPTGMGPGFTPPPASTPGSTGPRDPDGPEVFDVPPDVEDAGKPPEEDSEPIDVEFRRTE